jgi:hypothetical protein
MKGSWKTTRERNEPKEGRFKEGNHGFPSLAFTEWVE